MSDSVRPHRRQLTRLPIPGILQVRPLEWVAMSFSSTWKWKVKVKSLSCVRLLETPWTAAYQAPLSMGFSRQEYWSGMPLPSLNVIPKIPNFCVINHYEIFYDTLKSNQHTQFRNWTRHAIQLFCVFTSEYSLSNIGKHSECNSDHKSFSFFMGWKFCQWCAVFIYYCANKTMIMKDVNFMHKTLMKVFFWRHLK